METKTKTMEKLIDLCFAFSAFERKNSGSYYYPNIKEEAKAKLDEIKLLGTSNEIIRDFLKQMMKISPEMAFPYVVCFGVEDCEHANDTFGVFGKPTDYFITV